MYLGHMSLVIVLIFMIKKKYVIIIYMNNSTNEPYVSHVPMRITNTFGNDVEIQTNSSDVIKSNLKKDLYDIVMPNLKTEIATLLKEEKILMKTSSICEILKYVLLCSVPVLAMSAPQFPIYYSLLSYTAGAISVFSMGVERFGKVASQMSKVKGMKVKEILKTYHVSYLTEDKNVISFEDIKSPNI
jgi:hypothetical protein